MDKFEEGLRPSIQEMMAAQIYESYVDMVQGAKRCEAQKERTRQIYGQEETKGGSSSGQISYAGKKRGRNELVFGGGI